MFMIIRTVLLAAILLTSVGLPAAESDDVLQTHYEMLLDVGGTEGAIQTSTQLHDGHTFPVDFQSHKVDVTITSKSQTRCLVDLTVYEKVDDVWYQVNSGTIEFEATFRVPIVFQWNSGDIKLDFAIAINQL